ncbi:ribosome recycling factor [Mycoplasma marinum]|uniref:Ribosome-recycling factor n=1 Tax=Mycoplasma marinum TaxID=1937190 RepID=A0A4V2NI32_9MOLU|nr:ribosome recycling factor [Mycoplasma marinum]TCG10768.1 ribosome recycling factor [Mycoplasma marinum]
MELDLYLMEAEEGMQKAIDNYKINMSKISTGRANPMILNSIKIEYYGTLTPINQLSSISVPEPRQLLIKPFEQNINKDIVSVINSSSLGVNAIDEGHQARINFPELTTDRRRQYVKQLSEYTEQSKISVRSARQEANKMIKKDEELSEDDIRHYLEEIQKLTNSYISKVDLATKEKTTELMTI